MLITVDPISPVPNVGSQLERAVNAYLKACFAQANLPGLTAVNFFFSNDWKPRATPLIDVFAHKSTEVPQHTRDESYMVRIEAKWPGANQPGVTNTEMNWIQINNLIGIAMAALSVTDSNTDPSAVTRVTAELITEAGRALAVDGSNGSDPAQVKDAENNADMTDFTCSFVEFKGSQRGEVSPEGVFIKEVRNFEMRACPSNVD